MHFLWSHRFITCHPLTHPDSAWSDRLGPIRMYPPTVMAIENIIPKPSNSSYQDVSIIARASRMVLALDWKEPVYINTLLVICIAFLIQSALKSRKRLRRLEEEVRDVVEKWNDMERQFLANSLLIFFDYSQSMTKQFLLIHCLIF